MTRLTATEYRKQLLAQGKSAQEADAKIAAVMEHRASEDSGAKAALETQKAANYNARVSRERSGASGGSSTTAGTTQTAPAGDDAGNAALAAQLKAQQQEQQREQRQSATAELTADFTRWGLASLIPSALGFVNQGMDAQEIELQLQQTPEYQKRFSGNALRIANGFSALNPADYLSAENQYKQVLQSYGLPSGFYDTPQDLADFIGKDISPNELQNRAQIAYNQYQAAPQQYKDLWNQYFGTAGEAIAHILDPNVASSVIQSQGNQVAIGGAGALQGINIDQAKAQQLDQAGVTAAQAQQGFAQVAYELPTDQTIAQRFGGTLTQGDVVNADLLNDADAIKKRQRLYSQEKGLFNGTPGVSGSSLGVSQNT